MKKNIAILSAIFIAAIFLVLFGLGNSNKKSETPQAEVAPAQPEAVNVSEILFEENFTPKTPQGGIELTGNFFEALNENPLDKGPLGELYIDASTPEALIESLKAIGEEVSKLPLEEQKEIAIAVQRYMLDIAKSYPNFHDIIPTPNYTPTKEAFENFIIYASEPFHGKNFYDFMDDAKSRAVGRPPIEVEVEEFMKEIGHSM